MGVSHCSGSVVGSNSVRRSHRSSGSANVGWFLTLTPQEAGGTEQSNLRNSQAPYVDEGVPRRGLARLSGKQTVRSRST